VIQQRLASAVNELPLFVVLGPRKQKPTEMLVIWSNEASTRSKPPSGSPILIIHIIPIFKRSSSSFSSTSGADISEKVFKGAH
jgi:hypothetical protein